MSDLILELDHITKNYRVPQGELKVLQDVSFAQKEGEYIAIVGPSGAGKSTLLRLINGVIAPSEGKIKYRGKSQTGVNLESAIVFQNFGLFPWLNVRENVEIGLEARIRELKLREQKADFYIEKVGLEGYEEAYPKELSGGMKQRVGLARALAVEPKLLLMDEPFSSLDVLTAINLRDELLDIWSDPEIPVNTIIMVTHMIEEAIEMADRIIVLSNRPGRVAGDIQIDLDRPRDKKSQKFLHYLDQTFSLLA